MSSFTTTRGLPGIASKSFTATTQLPFELPQGFETKTGQVYRHGQMRLATGEDELIAQQTAQRLDQTLESDAYGILVRLSRVTTLSDHLTLQPDDIGNLFMPDLNYLLELYNDLNPPDYGLSLLGEPQAIPWSSFTRR